MIRFAATSTNVRKRKIMDMLQYFNLNASKIVQSFGIKIDLNFIKVPIRVLPSPIIEYLNGQTVNVKRGGWMMDKQQFLICTKPQAGKQVGHKWAIIYQSGIDYIHLDNFKKSVSNTSTAGKVSYYGRCFSFVFLSGLKKGKGFKHAS